MKHLFSATLLLIFAVATAYGRNASCSMSRSTLDIRTIGTALDLFELDTGRLPSNSESLDILTQLPGNVEMAGWQGPYITSGRKMLDPWGNPYVYVYPGVNNPKGFDIYSKGPDGISKANGNDPDDLNNWSVQVAPVKNRWSLYARILLIASISFGMLYAVLARSLGYCKYRYRMEGDEAVNAATQREIIDMIASGKKLMVAKFPCRQWIDGGFYYHEGDDAYESMGTVISSGD